MIKDDMQWFDFLVAKIN